MHTTLQPRFLALACAALLAGASALAAPPPWAGGGDKGNGSEKKAKHGGDDRAEHGKGSGKKPKQGAYFDDRNRDAVHSYYAKARHCPPGLAKKNNGCLPPGQAKKQWAVGQPLPSTVVYHPVPRQIVIGLPPVPSGHKYVEVAGDILLVAVGSMMVVDGINGLMSR